MPIECRAAAPESLPEGAQLPREYRGEDIKHAHRKSGRLEQAPIGPMKPLHFKANGPHGANKRVNPPLWIRLTKAECMSQCKKQQKNGSASIKNSRFHVFPPTLRLHFTTIGRHAASNSITTCQPRYLAKHIA